MILGIELRDGNVAVVTTDDNGTALARHEQPGTSASVVAEAVRTIATGPMRVGVAARDPLDPSIADVVAAAAGAAGAPAAPRVITRGSAVALGEQWCGAARDARYVVSLTASDHVQAGIVIGGQVFEGAHGLAGSAGWLALNPVEREDYRKMGCLEAEIGAAGIVRRLIWRLKSGDVSRVLDRAGGNTSQISVNHIIEAARDGDGVSISVVRDTARYIGMAIGNLVAIIDPDVVVLGGLIAEAGDLLIEPARVEANRRTSTSVGSAVRIVAGTLGDDAAALGAARAAMLAT